MKKTKVVVSCPIKGDNEYLIEFTEHYVNLGFDKIVFYDNNDDDMIDPCEVFENYNKKNKVEIFDYRNYSFDDSWHRKIFFTYYDFDWVLFVDDDEFLELKKHDNIKDFISSFDDHVTKIAFNNLHFGDNDKIYYEDGLVQDRFSIPLPLDSGTDNYLFNCAVKSLLKKVNIQDIHNINAHTLADQMPYYSADNRIITLKNFWRMDEVDMTFDTAFIKHYCTKSLEEFVKCKIKRAKTNNIVHKDRFKIDSYYYLYNKRTAEKDELFTLFSNQYL
jgi:hypothetical protein